MAASFHPEISPPPFSLDSPPSPPEYFDADFDFEELRTEGEAFEAMLQSEAVLQSIPPPPPPPNDSPTPSSSPLPIYSAWETFHSLHSSASFFKPKRYLPVSFPQILTLLSSPSAATTTLPVLLEVGSGAGAALFPFLAAVTSQPIRAVALDCSPKAIELLQASPNYTSAITALVHDFASPNPLPLPPGGATAALLTFSLSAVPPEDHRAVLARIRAALRPGGLLGFRDYGLYDLTMLRFPPSSHLYNRTFLRQDGTLSSFFEVGPALTRLFEEAGFTVVEVKYATVELRNKKTGKAMRRVFVHALLRANGDGREEGEGEVEGAAQEPNAVAPEGALEGALEGASEGALEGVSDVAVTAAIKDPLAYAKRRVRVAGTVTMIDASLGRIDVSERGGKIIVDVERAGEIPEGTEVGARVEIVGVVKKKARRTFLDAESVALLI